MAAYGLSAVGHRSWTRFDQRMKGCFHLAAAPAGPHAADAPIIDRAGRTDLAVLAMDFGPVGGQIGAIRRFDGSTGLEVTDVRRMIARRIAAVPRGDFGRG
jgi:hypothetical protein